MIKKIGKHRHLMTLHLRQIENGPGGAHTTMYHPVGYIFGQIQPLKSKEILVAMGNQLEVTHRVTIRYDTRVTPYMRLTYGKRIFDITSVVNEDELDRYQTLYCKEEMREVA